MTGPDTLRRNGSGGLRHLRPVEKRFSTGVTLSPVTLRHIGAIFTGLAARPVAAQWVWVISSRSVRINGGALALNTRLDGVVLSETLSGNRYRVVSVFGPYVSDDGCPDPGGYFVPCANNRIIVY